jgi:transposase InsO family protein
MMAILKILLAFVTGLFKSKAQLNAENAYLRHQLNVLRRNAAGRLTLSNWDRLALVWFYRLFPSVLEATRIVTPSTIVRWYRQGFRAYWRRKSRNLGGRPRINNELRDLIRQMCFANPLWGAPRIHGELLKLGIETSEATVSNYMVKGDRPGSQSWKSFLKNHADGIASLDLLTVPTIGFKILYCLVILDHKRRRIIHFAVTSNPTSSWLAQQITEAFPWESAPHYLIRDNDGAYGQVFRQRLRSMGILDRPTSLRSPWQNGRVERLIGSIRRECLDHVIIFNARHLRRTMRTYVDYYNNSRTHLSLNKDAPERRQIQSSGTIKCIPKVGGLHHHYCRI